MLLGPAPPCSLRIQAVTAGEAAGRSWNAVLQLGAPQHCLLHVQRPALLCQPGHLCMPPAVPSEQLCHPWRGWGVVALQALGLLRSSVPGTTWSLTSVRGGMCSQLLPLGNTRPKAASPVLVMSPEGLCGLRLCSAASPPLGFSDGSVSPQRSLGSLVTHSACCCLCSCPGCSSSISGAEPRAVLALPLLQGVRHNCGTLQQFQVVCLVLHLPADSQGSVDALL